MAYDLEGPNSYFAIANYGMHCIIQELRKVDRYERDRLYRKFLSNAGNWVNHRECIILLRLSQLAIYNLNTTANSDPEMISVMERFNKFLWEEVQGCGGFRVN